MSDASSGARMNRTLFTELLRTHLRPISLPAYPALIGGRVLQIGPYRINFVRPYDRLEHECHITERPGGGHYVFHHIYKNGGSDFVSRTFSQARWKRCAFRQAGSASCVLEEAPTQVHLTSLRDPIQRFFSGVAESRRRRDMPPNASHASIVVQLASGDFTDAHLLPQAAFLAHPRTGMLYNISHVFDIDSYQWGQSNPRIVRMHASSGGRAAIAVPEAILSVQQIRALCAVYRVDYDLFNFRLPRSCMR